MSNSFQIHKYKLPVYAIPVFFLFTAALLTSGCAALPRTPVPEDFTGTAYIKNIPYARAWGDDRPKDLPDRLANIRKNIEQLKTEGGMEDMGRPLNYLALSGGGADGAFGAGLLCGWSASGDRPDFIIVTGISAGALIAPFAFLGREYDDTLEEMFTRYGTEDLLEFRNPLYILTGESGADASRLRRLIKHYVDEVVMQRIAAEHKKGRRLLIGTTNLDAQRPVVWDIGQIAVSGDSKALSLIRMLILASTSIPGYFPPVLIQVEADGRRFDEMHVDGGVTRQVFLCPPAINFGKVVRSFGYTGSQHLYIIRNKKLSPVPEAVARRTSEVAKQSISTLIDSQGVGDLYRMYVTAQRDGIQYNLAYIPDTFIPRPGELFDKKYMKALFNFAFKHSAEGNPWTTVPPGFLPPEHGLFELKENNENQSIRYSR